MLNTRFKPSALATAVASVCLATSTTVIAQDQVTLNIPAGPLAQSLNTLARQAKLNLSAAPELLLSHQAPALKGRYTVENALEKILSNTPLKAEPTQNGGYSITAANITSLNKVEVRGQATRFGDAPAEPAGFKAEYQTTATKMAMSLKETPQAISVVTRDLLDARQVKDLPTALETTASVSNGGNGQGTQVGPGMFGGLGLYDHKFVLRGQPAQIRSDGFKIGNNSVDLSVYERVEVIKGPSGFYGQGSLGGFINMVRKKPKQEFDATITAQAGSFDSYRTELDITGALNEEHNLNGRLNFAYEDAGSFVERIDSKRLIFAPSIELEINEKTRLLAQLFYQKERFHTSPGVPLQEVGDQHKPFAALSDRTKLYGNTGDKSDTETKEILLQLDHQISDRWLASILLQKNISDRDIINPSYATSYFGYLYSARARDERVQDFWAGEIRLQGDFDAFGQTHQLLAGVEKNSSTLTRIWGFEYNPTILDPATYTGDFSEFAPLTRDDIAVLIDRDGHESNKAAYIQSVLSLQDKTKLLLGLRYDQTHSSQVRRDDRQPAKPLSESAYTGKIGLSHAFNDNITVFGIAAESFEPSWGASFEGPLPAITGTGYELGLKTEWLDQKLGINISAYHQVLTNRPIDDPSNRDYQIASGEHLTKGLELEVSGSPYPGWRLAFAYTLMDNEFTEEGDDYKGFSIDGSVDKQLGLYTSYEFQHGALKGLDMGASYIHVGDRNFINTNDTNNYRQVYVEGYDRLDLTFNYNAVPNWDLNLLVRNVTDENYLESTTSNTQGSSHFGSPRAVLFTANYKF